MRLLRHRRLDKSDAVRRRRRLPLAKYPIPPEWSHQAPARPAPPDLPPHPVALHPSPPIIPARLASQNARLLSAHLPGLNLPQCVLVARPDQSMIRPPAPVLATLQQPYPPIRQPQLPASHSQYAPEHLPESCQCREKQPSVSMHASDPAKG